MEKQIILQAENVSIGYSGKKSDTVIASGINLKLRKGSLISLVGANGIGKSTLLRTLTGIQKPLSGTIDLDGKNVTNYSSAELATKLSLVLTEKLPPGNLTVYELIALGRQPYTNWIGTLTDNDRMMVDHALKITDISQFASKKHYELSDGQLQKVLVARAVAQDTNFMVLDEPTTHLDLQNKFALFRLLKMLAEESGKCILFSTHDIEPAIQLSDEMIVMLPGTAEQGFPKKFIDNGIFDRLFPDNSIIFDPEKVKFVFKGL